MFNIFKVICAENILMSQSCVIS